MPWTYRPALDGLRSVAVYLVLLYHAGLSWVGGGFVGVDLFFVLSGFLVSNVILSEIKERGGLRIGHFYSRRVRRLLPAAVVTVVATSLVITLFSSLVTRLPFIADGQSALLYAANWHFLGQTSDYFAADVDKSPFLHFWSLAIEEQFYLVFPLLLVLVHKVSRGKPWVLAWVLGGLFLASLASQLHWANVDVSHAYYGTDARLYQLLAGALLALALRSARAQLAGPLPGVLSAVGLAGVVFLGSGLWEASPSLRGIGATAGSVLLITGLMLGDGAFVARFLSRPVPVFLGRISYGTYLWHWPVILLLGDALVLSPWVTAVLAVVVSTGIAAFSYEVLEMPIRKSRPLNQLRWTPVFVGVAASAVIAVTVVPWALKADRLPALVALGATLAETDGSAANGVSVPANVNWSQIGGDVGSGGSCTAADVSQCTVVRGPGPHVLVIGDSQAQMLVPMFTRLAKDHRFTLSLNVMAGCMWQEDLTNGAASAASQQRCASTRVGWYDTALPRLQPDVVILLQRARDDPKMWSGVVTRRDGTAKPLDRITWVATQETTAKIAESVRHTLIVNNLIMPNTFDPSNCLSSVRNASRCAVPVPLKITQSDGFYATMSAQSTRIGTVNLNYAFCPSAPVCQPVVGGNVVWRDDHHYTASYGVQRRDQVWRQLLKTGAFTAPS